MCNVTISEVSRRDHEYYGDALAYHRMPADVPGISFMPMHIGKLHRAGASDCDRRSTGRKAMHTNSGPRRSGRETPRRKTAPPKASSGAKNADGVATTRGFKTSDCNRRSEARASSTTGTSNASVAARRGLTSSNRGRSKAKIGLGRLSATPAYQGQLRTNRRASAEIYQAGQYQPIGT